MQHLELCPSCELHFVSSALNPRLLSLGHTYSLSRCLANVMYSILLSLGVSIRNLWSSLACGLLYGVGPSFALL